MSNNIRFPIAVSKANDRIVDAREVEEGLKCNCYCKFCKGDMIAVNKEIVQAAHFRHAKGSNCNANFETFIHWLTKEVFQTINEVILPKIDHLPSSGFSAEMYYKRKELFDEYNVPSHFYKYFEMPILQAEKRVVIENVEIEKEHTSDLGKVRVDIILTIGGRKLFVEPYVSNMINYEKEEKLKQLNIPTISINLREFSRSNNYLFSISDFKNYLIEDVKSKKWIVLSDEKISSMNKKTLIFIEQELIKAKPYLDKYYSLLEVMSNKQSEISDLRHEIRNIETELDVKFSRK